jgi:hypothetical protein
MITWMPVLLKTWTEEKKAGLFVSMGDGGEGMS